MAIDTCSACMRCPSKPATCTACLTQSVARHRINHEWFERLASALFGVRPPCMSEAEDWESTRQVLAFVFGGGGGGRVYELPPCARAPSFVQICCCAHLCVSKVEVWGYTVLLWFGSHISREPYQQRSF